MHIKVNDGRIWKNIYPCGKIFENVRENCSSILLIAMQNTGTASNANVEQMPLQATRLNRRGNSAISIPPKISHGPRAITSFKCSVPVPCKKRKMEALL